MTMPDMAQAERSLRRSNSGNNRNPFSWMKAIALAAKEMGYAHCFDVPDDRVPELHQKASDLMTV